MPSLRDIARGDFGASVLAGLQTGVLGGLSIVLYHALGSILSGQAAWAVPARLAAAAFGRAVHSDGLAWAVMAGISLEVVGAGLVGALFGLALRPGWALRRAGLLGPAVALGWYYFAHEILLARFGAGYFAVATRQSQVLAHLLFGLVLGLYPRFRRSLFRDGVPPVEQSGGFSSQAGSR